MAAGPARVAAIVRHRDAVLCCRGAVRGDGLALPTTSTEDAVPESALESLLAALGFESPTVERRGDAVESGAGSTVPFLESVERRTVPVGEACPDPTWESPTTLRRQDWDWPWRAYATVSPSVETVAADAERGSTAIAIDALWVLRDAAAATVTGAGLDPVASVAVDLLEARPAMAALANRVNRAMAGADGPAAVASAAADGIVRAFEADEAAAAVAAETIADGRVLTLSRSGTVRAALLDARPAVVVLASKPGGEGLAVADELASAGLDVEPCPDAAVYDRLRSGDVDALLVGADAVTPDGGVVNKVGTRAAALAAELSGVPCYVTCATDKVWLAPGSSGSAKPERPPYDPLFDWTPPRLVTAVLTERGRLGSDDVRAVAEAHRALAGWRETSPDQR